MGGAQTRTLNLLVSRPTLSKPSQQHSQVLIAVMILLGYIYKTDEAGQQRLANGPGIARFQIAQVCY
jgi:hypothetical protein